ncbi:MAG: methyltransferase domain-containing protein [Verrucomicrobiota bacterium]
MKQTQTDWEAAYRLGETPWEKGKAHPALIDFLTENGPVAGEVLVPGCGFGYDVRALSAPGNHVIGIDLAPFAISKAKAFPKVTREEYLLADLFALPVEFDSKFDVVFEHTCFCAIDPTRRTNYVETIGRVLKPGGKIIAIFFLNPDHAEGGPPYGVPGADLDALFGAPFSLENEWIPRRTYEGREQRELMRVLRKL